MYRAVIFDLDGTLVDTEPLYERSWKNAAARLGYDLTHELFRSMIGLSKKTDREVLCSHFGQSFPMEDFLALSDQEFDRTVTLEGISLKAGVNECLDMLDERRIPKAIATARYRKEADHRLKYAGIAERFTAIVSCDDVQNGKPAPDTYQKAAALLKTDPNKCIVIEDSDTGVFGAHASGALPIMVPDLKQPSPEATALAYGVFSSMSEAAELLDLLLPGLPTNRLR